MQPIRKIIKEGGGIARVAEATGQTHSAVHKWTVNGIPEKHWAVLVELSPGLDVTDLHAANESIRQRKAADMSPRESAA